MSEYEEIKNQLNNEKNKLMELEIEINAVDSDSYFYQKNNDLDKLNELSIKKENLTIQLNSQKELVDKLQSQFDTIKSKQDKKQKEEFKKEQKRIAKEKQEAKKEQERIAKEKQEAKKEQERIAKEKQEVRREQERIFKEKQETRKKRWNSDYNKPKCPKCGAFDNGHVKFCPKCGYQLRYRGPGPDPAPKGTNNQDNGRWYVRLFLKKKKDDGTYRFSISKIIGSIYAILEFFTDLFSYYFPENIIISIIAAALAYLICLIIGYIVRWIYNKYIK